MTVGDRALRLDASRQEALRHAAELIAQAWRSFDRFRPEDRFGIYSFDSTVRLVHEFSRDKAAAKRAVLRLQPGGATALFDTALASATSGRALLDRIAARLAEPEHAP